MIPAKDADMDEHQLSGEVKIHKASRKLGILDILLRSEGNEA